MSEELREARYDLPTGSEIIYTAAGGYPAQKEEADKVLERGKKYILAGSNIHGYITYFYLEDVDDSFNNRLFSVARSPEAAVEEKRNRHTQDTTLQQKTISDLMDERDKLPVREYPTQEATRDPIFLLQRRMVNYIEMPDGYEYEDGTVFKTGNREETLDWQEMLSRNCAVESWHTETVWFTRKEAEAELEARHYNYPEGGRVFCVWSGGELATLLKSRTIMPDRKPK